MKAYSFILCTARYIAIITILLLSGSCNKWILPEDMIGTWHSPRQEVTVRTEPRRMSFEFTKGVVEAEITINEDNTVTGYIGTAKLVNASITKGTIKCGLVGKMFENDPDNSKEMEMWFFDPPLRNVLKVELRYTENGAKFPMGDLRFVKVIE